MTLPLSKGRTFNEIVSYIAGFVDGEGTFCFRKHQGTRPVPCFAITQKDLNILKQIQEFFEIGFGIKLGLSQSKENKCWHLQTNKKKCVLTVCCLLYPHLIVKKKQASGLIEYINLRLAEGLRGRSNIDREMEIVEIVGLLNGGRYIAALRF